MVQKPGKDASQEEAADDICGQGEFSKDED